MEAAYKTILYQKDEAVPNIVYITLNRPEKRNAISIGPNEMTGEVMDAIRRAEYDDDIKVIIFRGNGPNFCAGFDLSMVYRVYGGGPDVSPPQAARLRIDEDHIVGIRRALLYCKKITIAQVHGWCVEGGIYFPQASDIAVAAKNARFAHRGQRLAFGGTISMPNDLTIGLSKKIIELSLTGRTISGEEAEHIGIITKAVEPEILEKEVYSLAKALCNIPADAVAIGKMARKHVAESLGLTTLLGQATYHTLATNLHYTAAERQKSVYIRDREKMGAKAAFHKLHEQFETALNETRYFRSYSPE
ncbi:MAG: enoyl-CoA hydratase/isomerase family protein [Chloroflexi bacterium]|nr:enoyl-CoA hydratase/isomerase family protein [Chloroflexota bacterium]